MGVGFRQTGLDRPGRRSRVVSGAEKHGIVRRALNVPSLERNGAERVAADTPSPRRLEDYDDVISFWGRDEDEESVSTGCW